MSVACSSLKSQNLKPIKQLKITFKGLAKRQPLAKSRDPVTRIDNIHGLHSSVLSLESQQASLAALRAQIDESVCWPRIVSTRAALITIFAYKEATFLSEDCRLLTLTQLRYAKTTVTLTNGQLTKTLLSRLKIPRKIQSHTRLLADAA